MTENEIMVILDRHKKWLCGEAGGSRANLSGAYLSDADLRGDYLSGAYLSRADLSDAYLRGADLSDADLRGADLSGADLSGAYLRRADLSDAYLRGADLSDADLSGADLSGADLRGAYLSRADLRGAKHLPDMSFTSIVPEQGAFVGWKKVRVEGSGKYIVKLEILADAKRSNATGRKCRCSAAKVMEIQTLDGKPAEINSITNTAHNPNVTYTVGEVIEARKRESDVVGYVVGIEDRTAKKKHRQRRK